MCMKDFLTTEQKNELRARHRKEHDRRMADRIKAVLLKDKGWFYKQIAEALMLDEETVSFHVHEYLEKQKLKPENGGSAGKLNTQQMAALSNHLEEHTYATADEICMAIERQYGIKYTTQGMTNLLHRMNFVYKKPKEVPAKADPEKQVDFVEWYENFKAETPADQPIFFADAVHPTMATKTSCGWIKKGRDKTIASTASRTRVNIVGAIELKHLNVITQSFDTINGESIIAFLEQVKNAYPKAPLIHVILDQSGYHRSKEVKEFAEQNGIKLHFLPPYSPNLNPAERLWKVMNEHVRNNRFFTSPKEFRESICHFFNVTCPKISNTLRSRINDCFQILKPASSF